jgi:hypothetical protein
MMQGLADFLDEARKLGEGGRRFSSRGGVRRPAVTPGRALHSTA